MIENRHSFRLPENRMNDYRDPILEAGPDGISNGRFGMRIRHCVAKPPE